ncbi:alpha/beta fold hydrolase [Calditrichota bacterium GD2]
MLRYRLITFGLFLIFGLNLLMAGQQRFAYLGDFKLESGAVIKNCKIGYRTFGRLNSARDNAILFPTWFGGTSEHLGRLIGPEGLIDSTRYFIIAVDALGNGVSSSPSNSPEQPDEKFPSFTITDMVRSQYRLLTEHLHINHLFAVIGGSMGGMQTFEWMVRYPDFMKKAVPYVGTPQFSSYDVLLWRQALEILNIGWKYRVPADSVRALLKALIALNARTPEWIVENWTVDFVKQRFDALFDGEPSTFTNRNFEAQARAMLQHDISKIENGDWQKIARRVKARVLIINVETDHMVNHKAAVRFAQLINARTFTLNDPCGHLAIGCQLKRVSAVIKQFLENE